MISLVENAFNSFLLGLFIKGEVTRALSTKANPLLKTIRVKLNIQPCYPCFKCKKTKTKPKHNIRLSAKTAINSQNGQKRATRFKKKKSLLYIEYCIILKNGTYPQD